MPKELYINPKVNAKGILYSPLATSWTGNQPSTTRYPRRNNLQRGRRRLSTHRRHARICDKAWGALGHRASYGIARNEDGESRNIEVVFQEAMRVCVCVFSIFVGLVKCVMIIKVTSMILHASLGNELFGYWVVLASLGMTEQCIIHRMNNRTCGQIYSTM